MSISDPNGNRLIFQCLGTSEQVAILTYCPFVYKKPIIYRIKNQVKYNAMKKLEFLRRLLICNCRDIVFNIKDSSI